MRLLSAISEATHQIAINQSLLRNTILKLDDDPEKALVKAFQSKYIYSREHRGFLDVEDNYKSYQRTDLQYWVESTGWSVVVDKECRPVDAVLKTMISKVNTEDGFLSVHDLCFEPERGLIHNKNGYNYLNYWQPVAFTPIEPEPEEMTMWDEYLLFLAGCSEDKRELIEKWIANAVLFPRQRSLFALLLYGESKGTGKGTLQLVMDKLLGIYTLKPEDPVNFVTGRFKSGLEGKTLCVFDEVYYDGFGFANHLKQMTTEPNFWVEAKGKDTKKIDNHVSILATSNRLQPIWVEAGDRRWMCINVEWNNPSQNGEHPDNQEQGKLVQRVRDWVENDRQVESKLLWLLQKVDLSYWD
ncbi:primase-helicase family protein [Vibrio cyclitrophicus]